MLSMFASVGCGICNVPQTPCRDYIVSLFLRGGRNLDDGQHLVWCPQSLLGDPEMQMYYPEDMQKALQSKPTPDEVEQTLNLIWEATTNDPSESVRRLLHNDGWGVR